MDEKHYKQIKVMTYLIFVQYMKHRMQIMQELWEYDLTTNSVKFVQRMLSPLREGDISVCNSYLLQSTCLKTSPRVKANAENVHLK